MKSSVMCRLSRRTRRPPHRPTARSASTSSACSVASGGQSAKKTLRGEDSVTQQQHHRLGSDTLATTGKTQAFRGLALDIDALGLHAQVGSNIRTHG